MCIRDRINVYISGSDTREDTLPGLSRSDVNILASINTTSREILLVSTPRDYYVPLSVSSGVPDKLTHAGIYGVQVLSLIHIYGPKGYSDILTVGRRTVPRSSPAEKSRDVYKRQVFQSLVHCQSLPSALLPKRYP